MATAQPATGLEWPVSRVRDTFVNHFVEKYGHKNVPSSATIPYADPTLLFTNSGMVQFKPIFQGVVDPNSDFAKLKKVANTQKCIRAGGKHNDLEDVGKDVYHHTFFEMLGNWSFGDYFKKEAIAMAWELLTEVYKLPKERLYITYFGGDPKTGIGPDEEAKQLWLEIGVPAEHILPFGSKENFWEMGETGPCGPCSEIHFDRIGDRDASHLVNMDDPDVLEIWNLVFMQYNREPDGSLRPLPNKNIDTGMGLERVTSVLQGKMSNYDTDVFTGIFKRIQELTGAREYQGKVGAADVDGLDMAYRVIADHVRTLTFAISDGGVPSNEGRGYVLRRILRRGVRYARSKFGVQIGSFFSSLVDVVVAEMGPAFPELQRRVTDVKEILDEEERSFAKTLDRGEKLFEAYRVKAEESNAGSISGADAWRLYDTYGFPVDLTRIMAEEKGLKVDEAAFAEEQEKAKEVSRARKGGSGERGVVLDVHALGELEKNADVPKTDDSAKYGKADVVATVKAIYLDGKFVPSVEAGTSTVFGVLLDKTNFYAEQGGQTYDVGQLTVDGKMDFLVEDVQVYAGYVLHVGYLKYGGMAVGDSVTASYDELRRWPIRNNHTSTHILNFALREVLGDSVDQKGSLVDAEKLRFDFSFKVGFARLLLSDPSSTRTIPEELGKVEEICNSQVAANMPVFFKDVALAVAKQIAGLRAVFGEVYPDPVRVVSVGADVDEILADSTNIKWRSFSVEFCGGTHVAKTGDIKSFKLLEEGSIAKGIRRIVAVTGEDAIALIRNYEKIAPMVDRLQTLPVEDLEAALRLVEQEMNAVALPAVEKAALRRKFDAAKVKFDDADKKRKAEVGRQAAEKIKQALDGGAKAVVVSVPVEGNSKILSQAIVQGTKGFSDRAVMVVSSDDSEATIYQCTVSKDLIGKGLTATEWANEVSSLLGGRHGGRAESAQGQAPRSGKIDEAIAAAEAFAKLKLGSA
ncbi:tRNA synthetases class II (A)-domain-containing protein [Hyaloraphidium curvatum]|nr:tRNA synthetases class II (A)-domain-containing protein [Hyaloraphidium curvatum]